MMAIYIQDTMGAEGRPKLDWGEEGNRNPLQYPCLENFMDRGVWWAIVHGVTKSQI